MRRVAGRLAIAAALLVPACGSGSPVADGGKLERGGTLTMLSVADVETLDPGAAGTALANSVLSLMHRGLYAYFPGDTEPDPDLAAAPPEVSADGRTVTVRLRPGVRFSGAVEREVRASDVKYAFERAFTPSVANGFVDVLYGDLEGVEQFRAGETRDIAGISTPDARTIVFRLRRGSGGGFAGALATLVTAPVPPELARPLDRKSPSGYGPKAATTGPYRLESYDAGRRLVLERNGEWNAARDPRPAYADRIEVRAGGDANVLSRQVAQGRGRVSGPFLIARSVVRDLERSSPRQLTRVQGVVILLAINTTRPQLDRVGVREAIALAIDRAGIARSAGSGARAATHFLPPGMPGFEQAGGAGTAAADPDRAKRLLQGTDVRSLTLAAATDPQAAEMATAIAEDLGRVGIETDVRTFSEEALYTKICTVPARRMDLCLVGILPFPNQPQTLLDLLFNGRGIRPSGNLNMSQLDDPEVNAALDRAAVTVDPSARAAAYAAADRLVTETYAAVPITWLSPAQIRSRDVRGEAAPEGWNLAFLAVR